MTQIKSNGAIVWEGRSTIDDRPIAIIITGTKYPSQNTKTGTMLQSYIIRQDIEPIAAVLSQEDHSICGDCPLRRTMCYVDLRPINGIWRSYRAGKYPQLNDRLLRRIHRRREMLRFGAYGDPTAAPLDAWKSLIGACDGYAGYTHQWERCSSSWQQYLMASVETKEQAAKAQALGWRTFRILLPGESSEPGERKCLNWQDPDITCYDCGLCNGNFLPHAPSIVDEVHGLKFKIDNFKSFGESEISTISL